MDTDGDSHEHELQQLDSQIDGEPAQTAMTTNIQQILSHPNVLSKICAHLPVRDLLTLRQACKPWNTAFVPHIRKKHKPIYLNVYPDDGIYAAHKFTEVMRAADNIPFAKYLLYCPNGTLQGFGRICRETVTHLAIASWGMEEDWEDCPMRQSLVTELPELTDLALHLYFLMPRCIAWMVNAGDNEDLPDAGPNQLAPIPTTAIQTLTKLKRLTTYFILKPCASSLPVADIIQYATELEDLRLVNGWESWNTCVYEEYHTFVRRVLHQLLHNNVNLSKLKRLQLDDVSRPIVGLLLDLADEEARGENRLALEKLTLKIRGSGWVGFIGLYYQHGPHRLEHQAYESGLTQMLEAFLAKQSSTLKEFTIWLWLSEEFRANSELTSARIQNLLPIQISLPRLEQLQSLTLKIDTEEEETNFEVEYDGHTTEITNAFPALRKLVCSSIAKQVWYYVTDFDDAESQSSEVSEDLSHVPISHAGLIDLTISANLDQLTTLPPRFPSITRLNLALNLNQAVDTEENREALSKAIWESWPALTHLKLSVDVNLEIDAVRLDEFLIGVARARQGELRAELDSLIGTTSNQISLNDLRPLASKYKTRPGISDLSRLEKFELDMRTSRSSGWILNVIDPRQLTDVGVYFGLALVGRQLKSIHIHGRLRSRVSQPCLEFLKSVDVFGPYAEIEIHDERLELDADADVEAPQQQE